jgi:glycosyltransferase involved in cell wall biosynthesis
MRPALLTVVAADVNNNLIDGSVIWLRNVVRAITSSAQRGRVLLLLRDVRQSESLLFPPDLSFPHCDVMDPAQLSQFSPQPLETLSGEQLPDLLMQLEATGACISGVLVRGNAYATALMASTLFRGRTCVYVSGRPSFASMRSTSLEIDIVRHARHVFVQSDALQRYYEVYLQARSGSVSVLPPMVEIDPTSSGVSDKAPVLSYSGKLDSQYCVEELVDLASRIAATGVRVQVVGSKFNPAADDPDFSERLRTKLEGGQVDWVQGASHARSLESMRAARFGFCIRSVQLDNSVELSTKLLEYCAQGTPPILRRTRQHVDLFGADYPYFADSPAAVADLLALHPQVDDTYRQAVQRLFQVARRFDITEIGSRLSPLCSLVDTPAQLTTAGARKPRLLVATHDDKFLAAALDRIVARDTATLFRDAWARTVSRAAGNDPAALPETDAVWCEWCCEQAVWWSHNKRPRQTLIVRLHRFEAFTPFPKRVNWSAVDHLIVVSDHFSRLATEEFGVPARIIRVLPQYVDTALFDRPKLTSADFTVGLVGINAFSHKRPDRAVDYIEQLSRRDPRFRLRVRSRMPWEYKWAWDDRPAERAEFIRLFRQCLFDPMRERVVFDRAGNDMPEWFRGVSVILSSSDSEGCHTSVAEGMASGAMPVCWNWPGAASVYGAERVHGSVEAMVEATLSRVDYMHSEQGRAELKAAASAFDISHTVNLIESLLP